MLTQTGAKLMDFGLAKSVALPAAAGSGAGPSFSALPTVAASPLTSRGSIVGTIQYMSPEQIEGREADARSDIFAFGAVLYEMVTGKRAFEGKTQISVASAILEKNPEPLATVNPTSPAALDAIIRTCLAKEPEERFASAHDIRLQLKLVPLIAEAARDEVRPPKAQLRERVLMVLAALLLFTCAWLGYARWKLAHTPLVALQSIIELQSASYGLGGGFALSPDGRRFAYGGHTESSSQVWIRALDSGEARPVIGSEGAIATLFWSPDGRQLGFFEGGKLKRVVPNTNAVAVVCDAASNAASWGADDQIVFSTQKSLMRVAAGGGVPVPATPDPPPGTRDRSPWFLPDGRHFLFVQSPDSANGGDIQVGSVDGATPRSLGIRTWLAYARYASGFLLYTTNHAVVAQAFDPESLRVQGEPQTVLETATPPDANGVSVSSTGLFAYRLAGSAGISEMMIFSRAGTAQATAIPAGHLNNPRLSPDGKRIAYDAASGTTRDIWVYDIERRVNRRVVFGESNFSDPVWSPDGKRIVVTAYTAMWASGPPLNLVTLAADGTGAEEKLLESPGAVWARSWSRDGRFIFFDIGGANRLSLGGGIFALPTSGDRKPVPLVSGNVLARSGQISSDGRWLAYSANESGHEEIYIQPFPNGAAKWQVSSTGGAYPRWRGDGRELYFIDGSNKIAVAQIGYEGQQVKVGAIQELFAVRPRSLGGNPLDVTRDGKLFVVNSEREQESYRVNLIANWPARLQ